MYKLDLQQSILKHIELFEQKICELGEEYKKNVVDPICTKYNITFDGETFSFEDSKYNFSNEELKELHCVEDFLRDTCIGDSPFSYYL